MVRIVYPGLVCIALAAFALPAAAQGTPDGITPANETVCDGLKGGTPGLYGTCVALCEAQDCQAEYNTNTGLVEYDSSCSPSSDQLFNNYLKIYEKRGDPTNLKEPAVPPCVQIACPCWTEQELDNIAGPNASFAGGGPSDSWAMLSGPSTDGPGWEWALTSDDTFRGYMCSSIEQGGEGFYRDRDIANVEFLGCLQSIVDEGAERKR
jgi:hypothetical protein